MPFNIEVSGALNDIAAAFEGAVKSVASFVKHPSRWFAVAFPLFTMENQRYWAGKLGASTGERLYDAGVKAAASKYLGPQGPQLVDAYNKVTEDAAQGNLNAREILAKVQTSQRSQSSQPHRNKDRMHFALRSPRRSQRRRYPAPKENKS